MEEVPNTTVGMAQGAASVSISDCSEHDSSRGLTVAAGAVTQAATA